MKGKKKELDNFLAKSGESRASAAYDMLFKCYICITYTLLLSDTAYNLKICDENKLYTHFL